MKKIKPRSYNDMPMIKASYLPRVSFDLKTLPQAKSWKVGQSYDVKMKLKQTGINEHESHFDITHVETEPDSKKLPPTKKVSNNPANRFSRLQK